MNALARLSLTGGMPKKRLIVSIPAVNSTLPTWMRYVVFLKTGKLTADWSTFSVSSLQATSESEPRSAPV